MGDLRMIRALLLIAVLFAAPAAAQTPAPERQMRVSTIVDGDTFAIRFRGLPPELNPVLVRIRGIDAPELLHPRCSAEKALAERARARLLELIGGRRVTLIGLDWDKYGGRVDADVRFGGRDIGAVLIAEGLARPYERGPRPTFCS